MNIVKKVILAWILMTGFISQAFAIDLEQRSDIKQYIADISKTYQFDEKALTKLFKRVNFNPVIIQKMTKPSEAKPWYVYRNSLITPERIQKGQAYWKKNQHYLLEAEQKYGVPASVIIGIIGVETTYGENKGIYPVMDALTTLAFNYPPRAKFFKSELTQFLLLCREQKWNPLKIKGSYAGAMGFPQFMPSSYRNYAVDYKTDGIDLLNNNADVINSVANYLQKHGWQKDQPIAVIATMSKKNRAAKLVDNGKPKYALNYLNKNGIRSKEHISGNPKTGLLGLEEDQDSKEYWLTFNNFATIMTYNTSSKYAMAVYQLGEGIMAANKNSVSAKAK